MVRHPVFPAIPLGLALLLLAGCGSETVTGPVFSAPSFTALSPSEAESLIAERDTLVILAVSGDFPEGHVPGALAAPWGTAQAETLLAGLERTIPCLVYDAGEEVSTLAAGELVAAGFAEVYRLVGGLAAWREAALPVARGPFAPVDLTPEDAWALITTVGGVTVIDVTLLYLEARIPGAVNYPLRGEGLAGMIPLLDPDGIYLIYDQSDGPSVTAARLLGDVGFRSVYRLAGNLNAWVEAGYPWESSYG